MVSASRPLFLIGNKRSGTTLLVKLLNSLGSVFVAHEADIVWLLYCLSRRSGVHRHPRDGQVGLERTVESCWDLLSSGGSPRVTFERVLHRLWRQTGCDTSRQQTLVWMGDKKPVQQCDPILRPFIDEHWPDALYIHLVRDPRSVARSTHLAAKHWREGVPDTWRASPEALLDMWATHEEWALAVAASHPTLRLRFEDLVTDPAGSLSLISARLGIDATPTLAGAVTALGVDSRRAELEAHLCVRLHGRCQRLAESYGYPV
jgi:hypothetical protein